MLEDTFRTLAISAGLGLLVGLQREMTRSPLGGLRTFCLVTILGTLSAYMAQAFGGWVIFGMLVAVTATLVISNILSIKSGDLRPGLTTEFALLVMFTVGAYLVVGEATVAIVIGGAVAVLLEFKEGLHGFAARLGEEDVNAVMRFVLIALVILPILPNRDFGPFSVLNPFEIWLMVVLIVGISLGAYIVFKFFGKDAGTIVGGILGGLISSTATTVSYSRRTKQAPESSALAAIVIMIASTILLIRVLAEIWIVAPTLLPEATPPITTLLAVFVILSTVVWFRERSDEPIALDPEAPSELKPAIFFGLLYAIVILSVAAAKEYFGNEGLYIVAAISGLTDVDAITLSTSQLVEAGRLGATTGWRIILIATLSNLAFKGATVAMLGARRLFVLIATLYGIAFAVGMGILLLWPT